LENLLDRVALERDPITELVRIYKETTKKRQHDPRCGRRLARNWSNSRQATRKISRFGKRRSTFHEGIRARLSGLDIQYDIQRGESFYNDRLSLGGQALAQVENRRNQPRRGLRFFRDIPELAERPPIIRKSDVVSLCDHDVATWITDPDLKADTVWLVVVRRKVCTSNKSSRSRAARVTRPDFRHITFGSILGEDRKLMKTRSGENVPLRNFAR